MLLHSQWFCEEIKVEKKINEKENTTVQNIWDVAKEILKGKFSDTYSLTLRNEKKIS